ncbi:MAG: hypothetical protein HC860_03770 [Alkalinema sp. RU_4_3]|nr:hypothetical protein [Alkalinema sp. RU_4_3]
MTIAKSIKGRFACLMGLPLLMSIGGSLVWPQSASACGRVSITAQSVKFKPEPIAQTQQNHRPASDWNGNYEFFETVSTNSVVKTRFYRISMLQVRCGWQAQVRLSGDDTPQTSVGVNVRYLSDNEIGLYYNGDKYDGRDRGQFQTGQLLLRIRIDNADTHRIFFEGIEPLVETNRTSGLATDPPIPSRY